MWSIIFRLAAYGLMLYVIEHHFLGLGFSIDAGQGTSYGLALLIVTIAVFVMERIIKRVLKIVTVPLNFLTLGLAGFVVNVLLLYVLQIILGMIPSVDVGIQLGSLSQTALFAVVLSFAGTFIGLIL